MSYKTYTTYFRGILEKFSALPGSWKFRISSRIVFLLIAVIVFSSCNVIYGLYCRGRIRSGLQSPGRFEKAHLEIVQDIPVIHLYGTPEEMGRQYGTILKKPLGALNGYLRSFLPEAEADMLISNARAREKNLPEDIVKKLMAISEASGVPYEVILALNITPRMACSALAVWGKMTADGKMLMGRNADYDGFGLSDRGSMIMVAHPKEGKKLISINFIGMIGAFTGINEDGVAFGNMLVFNSSEPDFNENGLTIQILLRHAAHKSSNIEEIGHYLSEQKHLIPMNVMIADKKSAKILELGTLKSKERNPDGDVLAVSNYFTDPEMKSASFKCARYEALMKSAKENSGSFSEKNMEEALLDAIIEGLNLQAVIFQPEDMLMRISLNKVPAAKGPYKKFDLKKLFNKNEGIPLEESNW